MDDEPEAFRPDLVEAVLAGLARPGATEAQPQLQQPPSGRHCHASMRLCCGMTAASWACVRCRSPIPRTCRSTTQSASASQSQTMWLTGVPPVLWTPDGCADWPAGEDVCRRHRPRRIRWSSVWRRSGCSGRAAVRSRSWPGSWDARRSCCVTGPVSSTSMRARSRA